MASYHLVLKSRPRREKKDLYIRLQHLFRQESDLIDEEVAIYKEIATEHHIKTGNRLRTVMARDDLMRRLAKFNEEL